LRILISSTVIIILDQLSKFLVKNWLNVGETIPLLGNTVRFTFIYNQGMAFGIHVSNKSLFTAISIFAAIIITYYLYKLRNERIMIKMPLAIILGGAIGNLLDRVIYGKVVDFVDIDIPDIILPAKKIWFISIPQFELYRWPIFNVADIAVTCGMICLIFLVLFKSEESQEES